VREKKEEKIGMEYTLYTNTLLHFIFKVFFFREKIFLEEKSVFEKSLKMRCKSVKGVFLSSLLTQKEK